MNSKTKLEYSSEEIQEETCKRVEQYAKFNFFERYAMYMGKAQILEYGLKNILIFNFDYDSDKLERWTLGMTGKELDKNNIRKDFIILLENVVQSRNYIAHELLVNKSVLNSILKNMPANHYSRDERLLDKSIIELEQLLFLYDLIEENNAWILDKNNN